MVVSPPPADISLRTVGRTRRRRFRVVMFKKKRSNIRAREKVADEGDDADEPGVLSTVNDKDKKPKGGTAARKKAAKKEGRPRPEAPRSSASKMRKPMPRCSS